MPQCQAKIKPPGAIRHRCPLPTLPGEDYCPLHLVMAGRLKERFEKSLPERLGKALGKE